MSRESIKDEAFTELSDFYGGHYRVLYESPDSIYHKAFSQESHDRRVEAYRQQLEGETSINFDDRGWNILNRDAMVNAATINPNDFPNIAQPRESRGFDA